MKKRETSVRQSIINLEECIKNYKTASDVVTLSIADSVIEQDAEYCMVMLNGKINEKCQSWKKGSKCHKCTNLPNKIKLQNAAKELKRSSQIFNKVVQGYIDKDKKDCQSLEQYNYPLDPVVADWQEYKKQELRNIKRIRETCNQRVSQLLKQAGLYKKR